MIYVFQEMSQLSFNHLLSLSFAWHTRRKTGEVLRILDRGAVINNTLQVSQESLPIRGKVADLLLLACAVRCHSDFRRHSGSPRRVFHQA